MKRYYSGNKTFNFWQQVAEIDDPTLTQAACNLKLEEIRVVKMLKEKIDLMNYYRENSNE